MRQERGQQGTVGERVKPGKYKDARAKCRFPSVTGTGISLMNQSGSIKAPVGTDLVVSAEKGCWLLPRVTTG